MHSVIPAHHQPLVNECIRKAEAEESLTNWLPEEIIDKPYCPKFVNEVFHKNFRRHRELLDNLPAQLLNYEGFFLELVREEHTAYPDSRGGFTVLKWLREKNIPFRPEFIIEVLKRTDESAGSHFISIIKTKPYLNYLRSHPRFIWDAACICPTTMSHASPDLRISFVFLTHLAAACPAILHFVSDDFSQSLKFIQAVNVIRRQYSLPEIPVLSENKHIPRSQGGPDPIEYGKYPGAPWIGCPAELV